MWEKMFDFGNFKTFRMIVPGGWIVMTIYGTGVAIAQIFVADPSHNWKLGQIT